MIPRTALIVAEPFPGLEAEQVAEAIAKGLLDGGRKLTVDVVLVEQPPSDVRAWWREAVPPERLRAARALVIAAAALRETTLAGSVAFEAATSARQAGVPAYAIAAASSLDPFEARMLDLQAVVQATTTRALRSAGVKLARALQPVP